MCNDNWNRSGFTHTLQVVAVRGQRLWYSLLMSAQNDWKIPFLKTCKKHLLCVWNDFPNDIYCFSLPLLKIPVRILHNKYIITVEVNIQQINVRQGQNDSMYATGNGWKQQHGFRVSVLLLTGNLCHHCLRDPPVPQERFDLLFHHAAVPPANTHTHTQVSTQWYIFIHCQQENLKIPGWCFTSGKVRITTVWTEIQLLHAVTRVLLL